jgi:hypothetical protein
MRRYRAKPQGDDGPGFSAEATGRDEVNEYVTTIDIVVSL